MKRKINKKIIFILLAFFVAVAIYHLYSTSLCFYKVKYPKQDISEVLQKDNLTDADYMLIFRQTGISPHSSKKLVQKGDLDFLQNMNDLYFKIPKTQKDYIAFPVTASEVNTSYTVPFADIKRGDILLTFNTHTLDWRHGHCAIVIDEKNGLLLEHMSIGNLSCITNIKYWGEYPGFAVLRYPDENIAQKAADYAENHLVGIDYDVFAGMIKKDKTGQQNPSSQCAHIVWQAYKAVGADIDSTSDAFVIPKDIAMSDKLKLVQIYGINPDKYKGRILMD